LAKYTVTFHQCDMMLLFVIVAPMLMSKRTITFQMCDGCLRNDRDNGIEIVDTRPRTSDPEDKRTLDICRDCADVERYICLLCKSVHDDEHLCELGRLRLGFAQPTLTGESDAGHQTP
jgi:hypothetical protein